MTIFEPLVAADYEWLNACNDDDYEEFFALDGQPRTSSWRPIHVRRVRGDERWGCKPSDFPWLSAHALVLRKRAVDVLSEMLSANGELLPLVDEGGVSLFVFNARPVDALDEAHSDLQRIPGSTRIMRVKRPVFLPEPIKDRDAFVLPFRASPTYVSERFVEQVRAGGLVGLEFRRVWDFNQAP